MTAIAISRLHFPVTTLGPGRRIGIWFQGCSIRCAGCISADTWPVGPGATTVDAVIDALATWLPDCEGITVSGGEPFDQPAALQSLLHEVRARTAADILVFSGHPFDRLQIWLDHAPALIDALVSEPFDSRASQTLALRGSDNQRLQLLTPLGRDRFSAFDRPITAADRRLDVMFDEDGAVWFAGIPARDDFHRLGETLRAAGHQFTLSTAPRADRAP